MLEKIKFHLTKKLLCIKEVELFETYLSLFLKNKLVNLKVKFCQKVI